ncbi:TspO/MBR family protein [Streptomyces sp. NPDC127038]|uniref:TspO/MBR family protein n=1 Tax=Streptomyces sp. NPDC127038 TaxID=3347114 RepID=UPI003658D030
MRILSEKRVPSHSLVPYVVTAAAVSAAAVAGAAAVDPDSTWYRRLAKPAFQPPPRAFGAVWPPLYASIAWAGGHALHQATGRRRRAPAAALGANLALNTAWNWLFFRAQSPKAGLVGTLLIDLSNLVLIRRTADVDRAGAWALLPYAGWCGFATALNAAIVKRNPALHRHSGASIAAVRCVVRAP